MDHAAVASLLTRAELAFAEDHLLNPPADSAYGHYRAVLALAPDQADAKLGLERIVERFIGRAQTATQQERWSTARSMLDRARIVDRDHPSLAAMYSQVRQLENAERFRLDLSTIEVRERRRSAADALAEFGNHARSPDARVIIRAGSDAEGRWMYEQLNQAPGDRRIRGEIHIGRPPRVDVVVVAKPAP